MASITEEMRFRQRLCEYAIKYGVTKAARKYHTNRQFVYRQLKKYDGSVRSLALKSRKPHCSPKAHTEDELALIKRMLKRNGIYGLAEVYVRCLSKGYTRSFGSMCRQIRNKGYKKPTIHRKSYTHYKRMDGEYPGHKIQVDNGAEFVNDEQRTDKLGLFQKIAESLGMQIRKTRPYSPWQNGKVERSHREDGKILYKRKVFTSEAELKKQVQKHEDRYNRTAKTSLDFKSPNQLVEEYFSKCNIGLDS